MLYFLIDATDQEGNVIIPMQLEHLKLFYGRMATDRSDETVKSPSTLTGYSNAIKFLYIEKGLEIDKESYDFLKQFSSGYKRIVADKKDKGIMRQYEGNNKLKNIKYCVFIKLLHIIIIEILNILLCCINNLLFCNLLNRKNSIHI